MAQNVKGENYPSELYPRVIFIHQMLMYSQFHFSCGIHYHLGHFQKRLVSYKMFTLIFLFQNLKKQQCNIINKPFMLNEVIKILMLY